jgi:hypothetical protein
MSEMVERVTLAIDGAMFDSAQMPCGERQAFVARAAIKAMREPTDGQRNAYYELSHRTEIMMDAHWERAIDAALSEKS